MALKSKGNGTVMGRSSLACAADLDFETRSKSGVNAMENVFPDSQIEIAVSRSISAEVQS